MKKNNFIIFLFFILFSFNSFSENNNNFEETLELENNNETTNESEKKEITISEVNENNKAKKITILLLDKKSEKTSILDTNIGNKIEYQNLTIEILFCWKSSPYDSIKESRALIKVFKKDKNNKDKQIFYGWILSYYPGISGIEDSDYDITLKNCK